MHKSKINKICNILKLKKADYLFISSPENVAWLMNIRGYDCPTSPIPNARLLVNKNKKIEKKQIALLYFEKYVWNMFIYLIILRIYQTY